MGWVVEARGSKRHQRKNRNWKLNLIVRKKVVVLRDVLGLMYWLDLKDVSSLEELLEDP